MQQSYPHVNANVGIVNRQQSAVGLRTLAGVEAAHQQHPHTIGSVPSFYEPDFRIPSDASFFDIDANGDRRRLPADRYDHAPFDSNTIFDVNDMLGVLDDAIGNPIDSILTMESAEGRVSLAYEDLTHIPRPYAETFAQSTHSLDLSHNNLKDLSFLQNFRHLNTLILDGNEAPVEHTLPYLPALRILWLNKCAIYNLANWLKRLQSCCPALKHLSLLGNPGCLSTFNGATVLEHIDYRSFVIQALPQLQHLDDAPVTDAERTKAAVHRSAYAGNGPPMQFIEKFGAFAVPASAAAAAVGGASAVRRSMGAAKQSRKSNNTSSSSSSGLPPNTSKARRSSSHAGTGSNVKRGGGHRSTTTTPSSITTDSSQS